jgi:UDP-glucose 4-epimerase
LANLLITGGAGFIGSHTCLCLLQAGHSVLALDNFQNGCPEALRRVAALAGLGSWNEISPGVWSTTGGTRCLMLMRGDLRSDTDLASAFGSEIFSAATPSTSMGRSAGTAIDAVLHFAGLKSVGESVAHPLRYWEVNVGGSHALLVAMERAGCRTIVFSSSATLYGYPDAVPIPEDAPLRPINPYGHTKAAVERMMADVAASGGGWRVANLRYFNPVGAHPSGRIGEASRGLPTNVFPLISQVAAGLRPVLHVYGADWPTPDGSGIRDYVHVMDVAEGHCAALDLLFRQEPQVLTLNLGTGQGCSVLQLVRAFEVASGRRIPWESSARRPGDMAISVADPGLALSRMGWRAGRSLAEMCRDGWSWQRSNPQGYEA